MIDNEKKPIDSTLPLWMATDHFKLDQIVYLSNTDTDLSAKEAPLNEAGLKALMEETEDIHVNGYLLGQSQPNFLSLCKFILKHDKDIVRKVSIKALTVRFYQMTDKNYLLETPGIEDVLVNTVKWVFRKNEEVTMNYFYESLLLNVIIQSAARKSTLKLLDHLERVASPSPKFLNTLVNFRKLINLVDEEIRDDLQELQ
ncbi:hypothetical protein QAD02_008737 [Eretmocerus hayati]|uniref:Uncharacterized protein n=1 Tax=Eretmocerus hayati TaxID=131215 RepID=A0ACC2N7A4_9HYME|nr:hypothetical protein QAD02_008737 [Eretmocerus hayati]